MNVITRAEIARLAGVSGPALSKASRGRLKDAMVGKKMDAEHPLVVAYIDEKRSQQEDGTLENYRDAAKTRDAAKRKKGKPSVSVPEPMPTDEIQDLEQLTVQQVVARYGSSAKFKTYVDALKSLADYKNKELLTRTRRMELIEKATTASTLFSIVDLAFRRLVTDIPDGMVQQVIARVQSGGGHLEKDVRALIQEPISKVLKDAKTEITKKLKEVEKNA